MLANTLGMLLPIWLIGIITVEGAANPAMIALADARLGRDLADTIIIVEDTPKLMDNVVDPSSRLARSRKGIGVLVGKVLMGPMSPVVRSGDSDAAVGAPGVRIVISGPRGEEVTSVITDDNGEYSVPLPPGAYRINTPLFTGGRFTKELPATVTIMEGQETHLDIRIDTGIR